VLAVLALACSPALAHAEEATGPQYESEIPTVPTEEGSAGGGGGHHNGGGTGGGVNAGISKTPGENGTGGSTPDAGGSSHTGQGNQAPTANGRQPQSGSVGSGVAIGGGDDQSQAGGKTSAVSEGDSSSPLVPILIAIAVLAAISIGAYYYRQRRQDPGSSVSPKAS
jgi:cobalamin biosynthesis Mg chelatase CobN